MPGRPSSRTPSLTLTAATIEEVPTLQAFLVLKLLMVAITGVGAAAGVLLGLGIAFGAAAIMRAQTQAEVHATVTPGTVIFAAAASVIIGLAFGLYPALRAARLSPIDTIGHE
jgi:ABC-type antimicrobial peptide transport system permease subunit